MSLALASAVAGGAWLCAVQAVIAAADTRSIELAVGALAGPGFGAKGIRLELDGADFARARLRIGELQALDRVWRDVNVTCTAFRLERSLITCDKGRLDGPLSLPLSFNYDLATGSARVIATPGARERWEAELSGGARRLAVLKFSDASIARIHDFAPELPVKLTA